MKKGGLTAETVEAKLRELGGNLAAVARHFGVTRGAVWKFCSTRPTLKAAADDVREGMKDHAESALQAAILRGEAWAVCFYLKTQARDRGYVERQEVRLGGTVELVFVDDFYGASANQAAPAVPASTARAAQPGPDEGGGVRAAVGQNGAGADRHG